MSYISREFCSQLLLKEWFSHCGIIHSITEFLCPTLFRCRFRHPSNASPFKPNESVLKDVCQANKIIHPGTNKISFITTYGCNATCYLFLWLSSDSIIISDIDGTITRSDVVGVLDTVITETFKHIHHGICDFFSSIVHTDQGENMEDENKTLSKENPPQIRMLYLTSRPLTLVNTTRRLFHRVRQGDKPLPLGPIFCYRGNILDVLVMEKISKSADRFKGNLLKDQITHAFATAGRALNSNLFVAAFGNKISDATAYESAGIRKNNIYIIDPTSKITVKKDIELNEGETENLIFDSYEDPNLLKDLKQKLQET